MSHPFAQEGALTSMVAISAALRATGGRAVSSCGINTSTIADEALACNWRDFARLTCSGGKLSCLPEDSMSVIETSAGGSVLK